MSARGTHRTNGGRKNERQSSVVGSKVSDASNRSRRSLPKGGIREQDGLKVAEGALTESAKSGASGKEGMTQRLLKAAAVVSGLLIVLLIIGAIALAALSNTSAFLVTSIQAYDSEHVSADNVVRLANIADGTTLLNVDEEAIQAGVKKNPWIASVNVERVFPDTLRLTTNERKLGAVVTMGSGGVTWLLGNDNAWIEPMKLSVSQNESTNDAALTKANEMGVILISDVPSTVNPVAGAQCQDNSILTVMSIASQLSNDFKKRVVCYSASSVDDISCILDNGVEVLLGSDNSIDTKEAVAKRMLDEYSGQVTYINVRTPSRPTYRRVESEYVREGTGATGVAVDTGSVVPNANKKKDEKNNNKGDTASDGSSQNTEATDLENSEATSDTASNGTAASGANAYDSQQMGQDWSAQQQQSATDDTYSSYGYSNEYAYDQNGTY